MSRAVTVSTAHSGGSASDGDLFKLIQQSVVQLGAAGAQAQSFIVHPSIMPKVANIEGDFRGRFGGVVMPKEAVWAHRETPEGMGVPAWFEGWD